jgi:hypothetical protein
MHGEQQGGRSADFRWLLVPPGESSVVFDTCIARGAVSLSRPWGQLRAWDAATSPSDCVTFEIEDGTATALRIIDNESLPTARRAIG